MLYHCKHDAFPLFSEPVLSLAQGCKEEGARRLEGVRLRLAPPAGFVDVWKINAGL